MIGAGSSFWGGAISYLGGNAKVYDAVFDYDTFNALTYFNRTTPFCLHVRFKPAFVGAGFSYIYNVGNGDLNTAANGLGIAVRNGQTAVFLKINDAGVNRRLYVIFSPLLTLNADTSLIINYTGSGLATGIAGYINGVLAANSVQANTLSAGNMQPFPAGSFIGNRTDNLTGKFNGLIRQMEFLNRVATPAEISATANSTTGGSFQAAGVANADYLLAVEFNKTGTANLTTRPSTPNYAIVATGGAAYTQYL